MRSQLTVTHDWRTNGQSDLRKSRLACKNALWRKIIWKECAAGAVYGGPHATAVFNEGLIEIEEEPDKQPDTQVSTHFSLKKALQSFILFFMPLLVLVFV